MSIFDEDCKKTFLKIQELEYFSQIIDDKKI